MIDYYHKIVATLRLLFLAATNVSDFSDFEKIANIQYSLKLVSVIFSATFGVDAKVDTLCCVPEYVISSDKCSIKILKIAKISCR